MDDLTDEELERVVQHEPRIGFPIERMVAEIRRHRAAVRADRERARAVVQDILTSAAREAERIDDRIPYDSHFSARIADRVADALASPAPSLTAERVRSVVREAIEIGMPWKPDARDARIWDAIADRAAERLAGAPPPSDAERDDWEGW